MNYDTWRAHNPADDEDYRRRKCATKGCNGVVTFADFENHCSRCLMRFEERKQQLEDQRQLMEVKVRRG